MVAWSVSALREKMTDPEKTERRNTTFPGIIDETKTQCIDSQLHSECVQNNGGLMSHHTGLESFYPKTKGIVCLADPEEKDPNGQEIERKGVEMTTTRNT